VDIEQNIEQQEIVDPVAYGGSRYRLSYDKYQGSIEKAKIRRVRIVAVLLITVAFLLFGFMIYRYYENSIRRFFSDNSRSAGAATANFQSYHSVETDLD
jgi:hypothetical protein